MSPEHVHMLLSVPPHLSVSKVVQYIKGKSIRELQGEFQEVKKRYWWQHIWTNKHKKSAKYPNTESLLF